MSMGIQGLSCHLEERLFEINKDKRQDSIYACIVKRQESSSRITLVHCVSGVYNRQSHYSLE